MPAHHVLHAHLGTCEGGTSVLIVRCLCCLRLYDMLGRVRAFVLFAYAMNLRGGYPGTEPFYFLDSRTRVLSCGSFTPLLGADSLGRGKQVRSRRGGKSIRKLPAGSFMYLYV